MKDEQNQNHDLLARGQHPGGVSVTPLPYPDTNPGLPGFPTWRDYDSGRPIREAPVTIGSSTVIDKTPPLKKGEEWYVRFPGARALSHVEIADLTPKTVLLKSSSYYDNHGSRYEKKDIDFVERCKAVESKESASE